MRIILNSIKDLFVPYRTWTKKWESNQGYIETLQTDVNDSKNSWRIALSKVRPGSNVLSAGCGAGREVRFLVKELNCNVTAIDASNEMIEKSKLIEPKAKYLKADMSEYEDFGKFDSIVCLWNTINFLPNKKLRRKFVRKSYNNLKKGGSLVIETGHKYSNIRTFARSLLQLNKDYYYNPGQIDYWFKGSGFKVRRTYLKGTIILHAIKL